MTSYKTLYENLLLKNTQRDAFYSQVQDTDFICPKCEKARIKTNYLNTEFFCSNPNCSYDVLSSEVFYRYAKIQNYEKVSE